MRLKMFPASWEKMRRTNWSEASMFFFSGALSFLIYGGYWSLQLRENEMTPHVLIQASWDETRSLCFPWCFHQPKHENTTLTSHLHVENGSSAEWRNFVRSFSLSGRQRRFIYVCGLCADVSWRLLKKKKVLWWLQLPSVGRGVRLRGGAGDGWKRATLPRTQGCNMSARCPVGRGGGFPKTKEMLQIQIF